MVQRPAPDRGQDRVATMNTRHPAWNDSHWLSCRQKGYDILCRYLGATPMNPNQLWRLSDEAWDLHKEAVRLLDKIEEKMGLTRNPVR